MASEIKIGASTILSTCETCLIGKQTRTSSQQQPTRATTEHLELVHSDVCGPITPTSQGGARYFVTFIDDYTRHLWLYPIKEKSQAFPCFKDFRRAVELASGCKVKRLRSDGGGEYANNVFRAYLRSTGIRWEPTVPYAPEQNGLSERTNRSISEQIHCMLADSSTPKTLWAEAANTAAYLLNRSPASSIGKMPYEAWHGHKPDLSHLRVFGYVAFAHMPRITSRKKLDSRSTCCLFLGYEGSHQYRVFEPLSRKVHRVRDVIFDEQVLGKLPKATPVATISSNSIEPTPATDSNENSMEDTIVVTPAITKSSKPHKSIPKNVSVATPGQSEVSELLKRSAHENKGTRLPTYAEEFGGTAARERTGNDTASTSRNAAASTTEPISSIAITYLSALDETQGLNTPVNEPTSYCEAIKSP
jgi:Integrase core domain